MGRKNHFPGILSLFLILGTGCMFSVSESRAGELDLRKAPLSFREVSAIQGEWLFYWNRFLVNEGSYFPGPPDGVADVPGSWLKARLSPGIKLSPLGSAAYRLKLSLPEERQKWKLRVPLIFCAYELYLITPEHPPELLASRGKTGFSRKEYRPWLGPCLVAFEAAGSCELVLQISNYHTSIRPGAGDSLFLGSEEAVDRFDFWRGHYNYYLQGGLIIISLFMFILFFSRQDYKAPLWLGCLSLVSFLFFLLDSGQLYLMVFPLAPFSFFQKLWYALLPLWVIIFMRYHQKILPGVFHPWLMRSMYFVSCAYILFVLGGDSAVFSFLFMYYIVVIAFFSILFYKEYITELLKHRGVVPFLLALALVILCINFFLGFFLFFLRFPDVKFYPLGFFLFILCHVILVSFFIENERRKAERLSRELERKIIDIQVKGEVADTTTGILHNVKNLLNSLHITLELAEAGKLRSEGLRGFRKANTLIREKENFFLEDPRARDLLLYYQSLEGVMEKEQEDVDNHLSLFKTRLLAIGQIISSQQKYGGKIKLEEVFLEEIIEDALLIQLGGSRWGEIRIERDFEPHPRLILSRVLLLHILINLIKNGVEALFLNPRGKRTLSFCIRARGEEVFLRVRDTGCGISRENLESMFSYGFSTKKKGHGFGLHSCKLYLQEMGGDIRVSSPGPGKGAEFTLILRSMDK